LSVQAAPISTDSIETQAGNVAELEQRSSSKAQITYYGGQQLKNPACGGPVPTSNSMVAAVMDGGDYVCGDRIKIKHGNRVVSVKVVDFCTSCSQSAIDLTPGAFSRLANLKQGTIRGAQVWVS
jgi:expansin (peptidoglycan-binding protein)